MKLVEIKHYVENSYMIRPSFVLTMSDGKDYISCGCQFIEHTEENVIKLIKEFGCEKQLNELLKSPSILISELTNAHSMFVGCNLLTEVGDFPSLTNGFGMFYDCTYLIKAGNFPLLRNGRYMFEYCKSLIEVGEFPSLTDNHLMFHGCSSLNI